MRNKINFRTITVKKGKKGGETKIRIKISEIPGAAWGPQVA
jgi:hypothetical protein